MKFSFLFLTLTTILQGSGGQLEGNADSSPLILESTNTVHGGRKLGQTHSRSGKEELEASLRNNHGDLIGEALIEFDGDDMTIDIELDDLPAACDRGDCFIAIHRGSRCGNKKGLYFDGHGTHDTDNPWTPFDSDFESDHGEASFDFETSNDRDYDDNKGRVMVIYAKKPWSSKRSSSKSGKGHHYSKGHSKSGKGHSGSGKGHSKSGKGHHHYSKGHSVSGKGHSESKSHHYSKGHSKSGKGHSESKSHHYSKGHSESKSQHHRALTAEETDESSPRELGYFFGGRRNHRHHSHSHDDKDWDLDDYKGIACGKLKKA